MYKTDILKPAVLFVLFSVFSHLNCEEETNETTGKLKGKVEQLGESGTIIHPAYIFFNDSLMATTSETGEYKIDSLEEGTYSFICSALNYRDTIELVKVVGGATKNYNFSLQADNTTGRLIGEFQDMSIFVDSIQANPELANWDEKQICDAATGATIQKKWLKVDVPDREIYLGDELLGTADAWGQYGFVIQCGTYSFKASCDGYKDKIHVVKILPDSKVYLNFFMDRE